MNIETSGKSKTKSCGGAHDSSDAKEANRGGSHEPLASQHDTKPAMGAEHKLSSSTREMRNLAEKMRRDKLNHYVTELAEIVPLGSGATKRVDKTSVLRLAANYIRMHKILDSEEDERFARLMQGGITNTLADAMGGFLLVVTSSGKVIYVSEAIEHFFGHSQVDLLGHNLFSVIHPDDHDTFSQQLQPKDNTRRSFFCRMMDKALTRNDPGRYEIIHVVGQLRPIPQASTVASLPAVSSPSTAANSPEAASNIDREDEDDQEDKVPTTSRLGTHMLVGFVRVVKDRPITELSLVESTQEEYITRHGIDGKILYTDHRISFVTGLMPSEVLGTSAFTYMHHQDMVWSVVASSLMMTSSQGQGAVSYRLKCRDGKYITLRSRGFLEVNKQTGQVDSYVCINTQLSVRDAANEIRNQRRKLLPVIKCQQTEDHLSTITATLPPEMMLMLRQMMSPAALKKLIDSMELLDAPTDSPNTGLLTPPSTGLTTSPSAGVSASPSAGLSASPSKGLSASPSMGLLASPSPSMGLSASPSAGLSPSPSMGLSASPSMGLSPSPSIGLSASPSMGLSPSPSMGQSASPSMGLSPSPSMGQSASPSVSPSSSKTRKMCDNVEVASGSAKRARMQQRQQQQQRGAGLGGREARAARVIMGTREYKEVLLNEPAMKMPVGEFTSVRADTFTFRKHGNNGMDVGHGGYQACPQQSAPTFPQCRNMNIVGIENTSSRRQERLASPHLLSPGAPHGSSLHPGHTDLADTSPGTFPSYDASVHSTSPQPMMESASSPLFEPAHPRLSPSGYDHRIVTSPSHYNPNSVPSPARVSPNCPRQGPSSAHIESSQLQSDFNVMPSNSGFEGRMSENLPLFRPRLTREELPSPSRVEGESSRYPKTSNTLSSRNQSPCIASGNTRGRIAPSGSLHSTLSANYSQHDTPELMQTIQLQHAGPNYQYTCQVSKSFFGDAAGVDAKVVSSGRLRPQHLQKHSSVHEPIAYTSPVVVDGGFEGLCEDSSTAKDSMPQIDALMADVFLPLTMEGDHHEAPHAAPGGKQL